MRIELTIEELVLHGFPPSSREAIGEAVGTELERLLRSAGVPSSLDTSGEVASLAGSFTLDEAAGAEATGVEIAHAVYRGLSR